MQTKNDEIREKKENGKLLFKTILNNIHKGNIEEMYNYFVSVNPNVAIYGNDMETKLINYCSFKYAVVLNMYKRKGKSSLKKK